MATTTNYGWTTPDDTALVKDGAAAIRTLGSSVDTTTKNLNPETTLGDIAYRSSTSNVNTRLALGTAGQVLTVNSGANAPEWATVGGAMTKITGSTSVSAVSSVTIDSCFSSTYLRYLLVYNMEASANDVQLQLQFRYGSSTESGAYYDYAIRRQDKANAVTNIGNSGQTAGMIDSSMRTSGDISSGFIYITLVGNSSQQPVYHGTGYTASGVSFNQVGGKLTNARTYTGIVLKPASGTMTGSYTIYGLAN
jgi:hypothetical protein